jgi:hypothetical protein
MKKINNTNLLNKKYKIKFVVLEIRKWICFYFLQKNKNKPPPFFCESKNAFVKFIKFIKNTLSK